MTDIEKLLLSIIGTGAENAVTQREITRLTGLKARDTRLVLERLRKSGVVVCSSNAGRFFPANRKELESYIRRIQSAVRNEYVSLAPARRLLKSWERGTGNG